MLGRYTTPWIDVVGFAVLVVSLVTMSSSSALAGAGSTDALLTEVVALKLGLNGYSIGVPLNEKQKARAAVHPLQGAYEGTYKFSDGDISVVVDKKTDRVLALYKRKTAADREQLKAMVVELMGLFNEPTTLAHDKILYWAFNKHGAVSEEDFNKAKKINQTPELGIIATVKLNSELEIAPDPKEKGDKTAENTSSSVGTVYYIITSDPLVQQFMADHS